MDWRTSIWLKLGDWLLRRRWWWISIASLSVFVYEYIEYLPHEQGVSALFLFEIIFYGVLLPLSTGIALSALAVSRSELAWSSYYQDLIPNLALQLHKTHTHAELADVFLQFIRVILPVIGVAMYKFDEESENYQTILNWSLDNSISIPGSSFTCESGVCPFIMAEDAGEGAIVPQTCRDTNIALSHRSNCICLPFLFSSSLVAGARLHFLPGNQPSTEQMRLLKEVAPMIASTYQRIHLERLMQRQGEQLTVEQRHIARDVHDTLGHSLAYLRLRLDQINMEIDQTKINMIHKEMESLRDVAKEAYDQMRRVLTRLSPDGETNLTGSLVNYADKISQQANFELKFLSHGNPRTLLPVIQRNIFYIFQEILTNVEKHANAKKVEVHLRWKKTSLEVEVADDGLGFDTSNPISNGHFGLNNIRERATESNASLSILSQPGHGTRLRLCVPFEAA